MSAKCEKGWVTLTGEVNRPYQKSSAGADVRKISRRRRRDQRDQDRFERHHQDGYDRSRQLDLADQVDGGDRRRSQSDRRTSGVALVSAASARPLARETLFSYCRRKCSAAAFVGLDPEGKRTQHGKPQRVVRDDQPDAREGQTGRCAVEERFVASLKAGNAGKGRDLSSRQAHDIISGVEIGQPIHSAECSETADGVARESGSRLSLLRPLRQDQPRGCPHACRCAVPLQQGRSGRRRSSLGGYVVQPWLPVRTWKSRPRLLRTWSVEALASSIRLKR